jgi:diguanylate cyclase (GGDEF)-like protein
MNPAPPSLVNSAGEHHGRSGIGRSVFRAAIVIVGVNVVTAAATMLLRVVPEHALWMLRLALSAAAVYLVWSVVRRHRRQWVANTQTMASLMQQVRAGDAPIEELSQVQGSLAPLATEVQGLLRELRRQRQELEELKHETKQLVANRTSALERTVNSLRRQATRDPLTSLYNRRMLDQMLPQFVHQCQADSLPLSLLMIDLDHFKELNDTLGHVKGDEMLKSLGQIIHSTIRQQDAAFRFGGDEFVVLLCGTEGAAAQAVADRLQSLAQGLLRTLKINKPLGLSVGICALSELSEPTPENLLKRADELLYASKSLRQRKAGAA